ncbi:DnaD domain protein [Secundilactobacillus paracollinoides]|uniref:Uncharacterized protein n=1 Tax=Secundilactobacillus paracollinoides TaxID=240427 RepID=A0A1B2J1H6_9LACO|nr:DnaD domain protein [Secundilactobacillus paracollinoides]ANZ62200.1 hypothetical protein AYR61_13170 [Secundilactobacillus paracollinoides]ANZ68147.1 hypothetical protein AYR63_14045 [Secundilactobacillus paracollinoides]
MTLDNTTSLTPKTTVAIMATGRLTVDQRDVLDDLYQPLIGVAGYGLLLVLWRQLELTHGTQVQLKHSELLDLLNISVSELEHCRQRLEALELIQTYRNQSDKLPELIYELQQPVSAGTFFGDDLLSVLLLDVVGEKQFKRLRDHFVRPQATHDGWQNISRQFLDVFQVNDRLIATPPALISETKAAFKGSDDVTNWPKQTASSRFDFDLLIDILKRSYVNLEDIKANRELILNEHLMYGLTEPEMADYINRATNLATNALNARQLQAMIASEQRNATPVTTGTTAQTKTAAASEPQKQSTTKHTPQEQALITVANQVSPMAFLTKMHEEKGGYVTGGEQRIVEGLLNKQVFPNAVVNVLIFYLLMNMKQSTLTQRLTDTIANSWAQASVKTPEDALKEIHRYQKERDNPQPGRKGNRRQQGTVKETLPDWAKSDYQPDKKATDKSVSDAQQQRAIDRLKKLKSERQNREGGDA